MTDIEAIEAIDAIGDTRAAHDAHAADAGTPPTLPWSGATNPVLPGFNPDPSVCRVDGADGTWFYLVTSTFEYLPGLPVYRSRDLVTWELIGSAIHRPGHFDLSGVGDSGGMFAPTIRHDGRRFLLVCTQVGGPAGQSGNFIISADDPAGPWSEPVWWGNDGMDPSILLDDDGRIWAHGTRLARVPEWDQQTEVWVRELDPATLELIGEEHVVWTGAVRGAVWAEGPHLYRRGSAIYLLASEGGTAFHHAVSVARSDSPTGPFAGNPANPVLTHRHLGHGSDVINVGHADLVTAPDGTTWAVALASRPVGGVDVLGRETFLVPVEWQDEWPVFAPAVGSLVAEPPRPEILAAPSPRAEGHGQLIAVRRYPHEIAVEGPDGTLTVAAGDGLTSPSPAFVGRRLTTIPATVSVTLDEVPPPAAAGLALRYSSAAWVAVTATGQGADTLVQARLCDAGGERVLAEAVVPGPPRGRASFEITGLTATAVWEPVGGGVVTVADLPLDAMGAVSSGGFVGLTWGVVAEGEGAVRARGLEAR